MVYLQIIGLIALFQGYQIVQISFYLSMPIDNATCHERLGILNSLNTPLYCIHVIFIKSFHSYNYSLLSLSWFQSYNSASFALRFLKLADLTVLLLFFIQNLLSHFSNIEQNFGPKYSSLTSCHWKINLLLMTPLKYDCFKGI